MQDYSSVLEKIRGERSQVVYLSGKTCTGKTTLANYIQRHIDCGIIELDEIVWGIDILEVKQRFVEAYRHRSETELIREFVRRTKRQIEVMLAKHSVVLFEGAIANDQTLAEIVGGRKDFLFIYLLPVHLAIYKARIVQRFMSTLPTNHNGLPAAFWEYIDRDELSAFYQTRRLSSLLDHNIASYTIDSIEEAKQRLDMFSETFPDITVIKV